MIEDRLNGKLIGNKNSVKSFPLQKLTERSQLVHFAYLALELENTR